MESNAALAGAVTAAPSIETLEAMLDVTYTWGYQETRAKLRDLYDKATRAQWIAEDVLPWDTDVDLGKPMGPEQLMPLFGSDISHWDVPDMSEVLGEAWEMVEHEQITDADFRAFMFTNPVDFYTHANPAFFDGTRVESAVRAVATR